MTQASNFRIPHLQGFHPWPYSLFIDEHLFGQLPEVVDWKYFPQPFNQTATMKSTCVALLGMLVGTQAFQARVAPWTGYQARAAPWTGFQARAAPWTGVSHARSSTSLSMAVQMLSDEEVRDSMCHSEALIRR